MSNFGSNQFCVMILIICSCHIMDSVKLLDNDVSMIMNQTHVHSNVSRSIQTNRKVPIAIRKRKRSFLDHHISLHSGIDNPNYEQKLMVDTLIKSSNGLFKSESNALDDKATDLVDTVRAYRSKLGLYKSRYQGKTLPSGRMKRYLFLKKVGTIRPLDHVRNGHGARRCDRDGNAYRMCLPKERILRSRQSNLLGGLYINDFHILPKFKRRQRSSNNGRRVTYNRTYLNKNLNHLKNSFKGDNTGEVEDNKLGKMSVLSIPNADLKNLQSIAELIKSSVRFDRRKQDDEEEHVHLSPLGRSRCSRPVPTVIIKSVNIGRTGRIRFPSSHRCMAPGTCPCSVSYRKCPPRTTCCMHPETLCFETEELTTSSTMGRCHGIDTDTPTPIADDMCRNTENVTKRKKKRCACDCGCGCPHNLRRAHPDRALARGSCGCGCGCGCFHHEVGGTNTRKPPT